MRNNHSIKIGLTTGIAILFIISAVTPMTLGYNAITSNNKFITENQNFDSYHISEITSYAPHIPYEYIKNNDMSNPNQADIPKETLKPLDGPMDSPWSMYCHDVRHTGQSPYSTADNPGDEIWKLETYGWAQGGPVINEDGTVYIGAYSLYAVYPNGTLKWKYDTIFSIVSAPAIDENGVIYFGTIYGEPSYLYALYPNGTLKWKYPASSIFSSPAIGSDGTIYFGDGGGYPPMGSINAVYPNGSLKWEFNTDHVVYSSPAIGDDGTVYCGSHDTYLYALYPNNGTVKWKYKTGNWIRTSPCIADDGAIYVVSLDDYLHAVNPDGSLKWKTNVGAGTSPTIGQDGTIYAGYRTLHAVNLTDGSVKWTFPVGGAIQGGTPCNSVDGIIYVGTGDNGEIIAINSDGTERWRKKIGKYIDSPPAIGEDGTVYVGSSQAPGAGFLHAFGPLDPNAPSVPDIDGSKKCKLEVEYEYNFTATSPIGNDVYYWIEWGDNSGTGWIGPYASGEQVTVSHKWIEKGTWTIRARAKDTDNLWGPWGEFEIEVTNPRNKVTDSSLFLQFLERFPILERLLNLI